MVEVRLTTVQVDLASNTPVVLLQETEGARTLPIFIGNPEATAIAFAIDHVEVPRPLTHDLLGDVVSALGGVVTKVVITDIRDKTYFAEIHIDRDGRQIEVSARPSDAIAIALRAEVPIFVEDDLMSEAGILIESDEDLEVDEADAEELEAEFREFLSNVRPEDFEP